jgi:hypothetical protein
MGLRVDSHGGPMTVEQLADAGLSVERVRDGLDTAVKLGVLSRTADGKYARTDPTQLAETAEPVRGKKKARPATAVGKPPSSRRKPK